jgi:thymidylate synthase (FAD)
VLDERFFVPERDNIRINNKHNKQSSGSSIEEKDKDKVISMFEASYKHSYNTYQSMLELGVAREIARSVLPVGIFTEFYLTVNLNNLFKFLRLRVAEDCQYETRIVAKAMMNLVEPLCPCAFKAWREYSLNSISLGKHEIEAIKNKEKDLNKEASKGEQLSYHKKLQLLNI